MRRQEQAQAEELNKMAAESALEIENINAQILSLKESRESLRSQNAGKDARIAEL